FRPPRDETPLGVAADLPDGAGAAHAVPDLVHVGRLDVARDDPAAREAAAERETFLVRPDDHLERMACADAAGAERFQGAERRQRSEVAVEVAAVRHRVDVGAEEDRREAPARGPAPPGEVAGRGGAAPPG